RKSLLALLKMMNAELRKTNSRRGFLHPFKSFSTSRVHWRVQPPLSPERPEKDGRSGGFFAQLRRSFTLGQYRPSSSSSSSSVAAAENKYTRSSSVHGGTWGKRMKQGLSKPLKVVTDSYVGCMMGISEDPRVEALQSMGFHSASASHNVFLQASASRRLDRSSSPPPPHSHSQ
ncbi:hypothetical protein GOP47_0029723, partial [Adiantum capillus-veneris]